MSSPNRSAAKSRWEDLAVFGGEPAFAAPLHVGRPVLPDRCAFDKELDAVWESGWLTNNGPKVQQLEEEFVRLTGARHAIAVCNATLGLQLVARALELDGEVVMPAFTFIATAHAFRWEGLRPVFCDVDPETHVLDPKRVPAHLSEATAAIVGVHLWGNDSSSAKLESMAAKRGLHVVYDAAHALGGAAPASLGEAQVYSLHATKMVSGFEGGVVVTDSDLLAHRLRAMRNFGFAGYDDVRSLGTNAKMSEASAVMALCSLKTLPATLEANRRNHELYREAFADRPGLTLCEPANAQAGNRQYLVARIDQERFGVSRDDLMSALWAEGVRARRYFYPGCHWSEPYRWECPDAPEHLPVTERLCREVLVFPTGPHIGPAEIQTIGQIVAVVQAASRRIAEAELPQAA